MLLKFTVKDFLDAVRSRTCRPRRWRTTVGHYEFHVYLRREQHRERGRRAAGDCEKLFGAVPAGERERPFFPEPQATTCGCSLTTCSRWKLVDARSNPTKAVKLVKARSSVSVFIDQQIREMLGYFGRIKGRDKTLYAYRDYAMVGVLLGTGVRLGELVNLR